MHCLIAAFDVERGVAISEVVVIDTDPVTIVGSGAIDLGARRIDMRFTPTPRNPGALSIAAPVAVRGPLADPEVIPEKGTVVLSAVRNFVVGTVRQLRRVLLPGRAELVVPERWRSQLTGEGPCASALRRAGTV